MALANLNLLFKFLGTRLRPGIPILIHGSRYPATGNSYLHPDECQYPGTRVVATRKSSYNCSGH
eukprot:2049962-Rhodomonas_salina.1